MTTVERKVDVCLRFIAARNDEDYHQAIQEAREILSEDESVPTAKEREPVGLTQRIEDLLTAIGVPCHLKGYDYLVFAIEKVVKETDLQKKVTSELYPLVAKKFNTSAQCAERCIRGSITYVFDNSDVDILSSLFGNSIPRDAGKATNSQFIATLAREVRRNICVG